MKYDYFEALLHLSDQVLTAVRAACGEEDKKKLPQARQICDELICQTETALFRDFLPPLERDSLAICAHGLSRIVDVSLELSHSVGALPPPAEGRICVELASLLRDSTALLPSVRKPDQLPDLRGYRTLLAKGLAAHESLLASVRRGSLPHSSLPAILLTGQLRMELSHCFDTLLEVMLRNI